MDMCQFIDDLEEQVKKIMIFHNSVILLDDISDRFCVKCIPIPSPFMMTGMECQKWLCEDIWNEAKSTNICS